MRAALGALVAALALVAPARAQTPDSTASVLASPADSLAPPPDSLRAPASTPSAGRPPLAPFGPAVGRPITPVPAVTASLDAGLLISAAPLGENPAAFAYALGAPGRTAGVSLDGLAPDAPALTLDGRPLTDLVTDAPRLDLLPLAAVGPLRQLDGALGREVALAAGLRSFRLAVPVTELRYLGGQNGVRHVSGTHAQTRRPPAFLRGGTDEARLTATFHAASRGSDSPLTGANLRHTDALGRLLLTRPGLTAEVGVRYADQMEGARRGLVASAGQPATALFSLSTATVLDPSATRRTIWTEAWARARLGIVEAAPTEVGASVAVERLVYALSGDTVRVHGRRIAAFAEQPARLGPNALALRLDVVADGALGPEGGALAGAPGRLSLHGTVVDSLGLGPARAVLGVGAHRVGEEAWPSASARVSMGPASVGVRYGGRAPSRLELAGLAGRVGVDSSGAHERTLAADAALAARIGEWRIGLRAFASVTRDGRHLVSVGDTLAVVTVAPGVVRQSGAGVAVGWREAARRGLYVRAEGVARAVLSPSGDLDERLDAALPRAWASGRVGLRAEGIGDGVLDLDLAAVGLGWTSFRSRRLEPTTGLLVLPEPGAGLGIEIPARATLGLEATATFSARASLFLRYDHALGERVYNGALVTQGEPLAPHVVRFGVFWALLN